MDATFTHLHLHTEFSIVDGLLRIEELVNSCAKEQQPAVAVTDLNNLFALVKFYRAAISKGIKPIIGSEILLNNKQDIKHPYSLILLCQNQVGYRNLTRLISRAYLEGQHLGVPQVKREWLAEAAEGLIALSGAQDGDVGHALLANNQQELQQLLTWWQQHFPQRFYLELQRIGRAQEDDYIQAAVQLAEQQQLPLVATNNVRFLRASDFEAHEARYCVHAGYILDDPKRPHLYTDQQYLRSPQQMQKLFTDLPEALANSVEIAKRCNLQLELGKVFLPNFPIPEGQTLAEYFTKQAVNGLEKRLAIIAPDKKNRTIYEERLQHELKVIQQMGFAGYFLIVADFIDWAKNHGVPVGPGRGSGAGSLVAYALGITDLDPIELDLLFERFLNPERVSMPDFDIDFCMEGRDRVIEYVAERYGRDSVSQIITYGTMAAKAVVRDVGRVLGYPYGFVDQVAKMIPFELGMTLQKALQQEEVLLKRYNQEEDIKTLIDLALKLEGITRNAGKHAGGVVIAPSKLTDFVPLYCEEGGKNLITQFDKNDVETIGLVKFDFLGLRTLTIINWTLQAINAKRDTPLDILQIPLDDKKTFALLKAHATTAVFQLESRGMQDLIKRLKPDSFEDIMALVALFRPGPLQSGMVEDFIDRKQGRARVTYPHADLEQILKPTYGVILYQEQVMQIAQVLANYSLGAADILRKAMGKKKPEEMAKQRAIFIQGAAARHVDKHLANGIFDLMEKFAGYGFNKSHSAAYALISYQTAWLKAHYPAEFMAAVLSSDMDNTDKVVVFNEETKRLGLTVVMPHINVSQYKFSVNQAGEIIYGLGAIKGVGEAAIESILKVRGDGEFKDLYEFCRRVDNRKVNKRVLEALIKSGAMDSFKVSRAVLCASVPMALRAAEQIAENQTRRQNDLFGGTGIVAYKVEYAKAETWSEEQLLLGEKEALGFYISGHPISFYQAELTKFVSSEIAKLEPAIGRTMVVAGFVTSLRNLTTRTGKRMVVITLEDHSGRIDGTIFADLYDEVRSKLTKDKLLVVEGEVSLDDFSNSNRIRISRVLDVHEARISYARCLVLRLQEQQVTGEFIQRLTQTLEPYRGGKCPVCISYLKEGAKANLALGEAWKLSLSEKLLSELEQHLPEECIEVVY